MDDLPSIGPTANDRWVSYIKGLSGAVPWVGGALGEWLGAVIPNQRIDRVEQFIRILAAELERRANEPIGALGDQRLGLLEEGLVHAAKPVSDERRERLAALVAEGIVSDEAKAARHRKLLTLLTELDDYELAILRAYGKRGFQSQWKLRGVELVASSDERKALTELGQLADLKLERVGLVKFHPQMEIDADLRSRAVKYDTLGNREGSLHLTPIGGELVNVVGLEDL